MSCRHRKSWIICGGRWYWCWACGAICLVPKDPRVRLKWVKPVGDDGENPWPEKWGTYR